MDFETNSSREPIRGASKSFQSYHQAATERLVETLGRRHGSLDDQATDVLPSLLQQRDKVVDGQHDVGNQLLLGHADVTNSDSQAKNLLELELDGGLDLVDLAGKVVVVADGGGELASLGQTGTEKTGDLLDQGVGGDESRVLAGQLLDQLLVLVELLQVVGGHGVDTTVLRTIDIVLVTEDADLHVGTGDGGQLDGAGETLITLGVIVLQADLKLDGLCSGKIVSP